MRLQGNKQDRCQLWVAAVCQKSEGMWKWIAVLGGKAAKKWPLSCLSGLRLLKLADKASFNQGAVLT